MNYGQLVKVTYQGNDNKTHSLITRVLGHLFVDDGEGTTESYWELDTSAVHDEFAQGSTNGLRLYQESNGDSRLSVRCGNSYNNVNLISTEVVEGLPAFPLIGHI